GLKNFIAERGVAMQNSLSANGVSCWAVGNNDLDEKLASFSIFPNPASHYIRFNAAMPVQNIRIYDVTGHLLLEFQPLTNEADISHLAAGLYIVEVNGMARRKLLKE
ncbi:MAG: T9SS type A sorting domain-containing protein, partial [Chitinophagaceae bacterium]|nr:T9SS type A sorting domain-containing protein [Chitinophagaceae bacterium]